MLIVMECMIFTYLLTSILSYDRFLCRVTAYA